MPSKHIHEPSHIPHDQQSFKVEKNNKPRLGILGKQQGSHTTTLHTWYYRQQGLNPVARQLKSEVDL